MGDALSPVAVSPNEVPGCSSEASCSAPQGAAGEPTSGERAVGRFSDRLVGCSEGVSVDDRGLSGVARRDDSRLACRGLVEVETLGPTRGVLGPAQCIGPARGHCHESGRRSHLLDSRLPAEVTSSDVAGVPHPAWSDCECRHACRPRGSLGDDAQEHVLLPSSLFGCVASLRGSLSGSGAVQGRRSSGLCPHSTLPGYSMCAHVVSHL